MNKMKRTLVAAATLLATGSAFAGPFILAGTDADDHGSVSAGANLGGWLFMQRALENIGAGVTNSNNRVAILGSTTGEAAIAANSAFNLSSLVGVGWTSSSIAIGDFANFFGGVGTVNISNVGILMMDSGGNVGGGVDGSAFTPHATTINSFVGGGGGLFSQANGYAWLTALLPAVTAPDEFATGLTLTAAGTAAFPGLTNAHLSTGPYHNRFVGFSPIPILATSNSSGNAIIIGGTGGSITNPGAVPEPATLALLGVGFAGLAAMRRRKS